MARIPAENLELAPKAALDAFFLRPSVDLWGHWSNKIG